MDYRKELLKRARAYCAATQLELSTVATQVMNDGKFFKRLLAGGGCTMDTFQKVMRWFDENTPEALGKIKKGPGTSLKASSTQTTGAQ